MRNIKISPGEYYHIYNRGVNKQIIFRDLADYKRFLFLILYFQSPEKIEQINRYAKDFLDVQHSVLDKISKDIKVKRLVELNLFCLMNNHFHLIVREVKEGGIARYMQRVLNSYTKYFNTKYSKSGHLFQGPYQAVHIEDDRQLLHLSAYIHKNPDNWGSYEWSTYEDYIKENRWGNLLESKIIVEQFKDKKSYQKFVETSLAKELENELGSAVLDF